MRHRNIIYMIRKSRNKRYNKKRKRIYGKGFFTGYSNLLTKIIKKTI